MTVAVNILMFVPFLAMLFAITLRDRECRKRRASPSSPKCSMEPATRCVIRSFARRVLLTALYSLTVRGAFEILPAIADGEYHRGAEGLGQMLAASGGGALAAAIFVAFRPLGHFPIRYLVSRPTFRSWLGIAATGALGLADDWFAALATVGVLGFGTSACAIDLQTAVQLAVSEAYRGRIMGIWIMLVIGGAAMNAIVLGFFADIFGMPHTLVGAALIAAACLPFGIASIMKWRKAELPGT